ncbi:MAG TPA: aminodeoxychorismate synthase component I [Opitutaceae bacterium]|nr:aminodeoxychorismate synthase component I [Opitutaceae bacterium]
MPRVAGAPADIFLRLARRPGVFWLDSSLPREGDGRFSVMGCDPRFVFIARGSAWKIERSGRIVEQGDREPLRRLDDLVAAHRVTVVEGPTLPFWGGAVGWCSYDLGRQFESFNGSAVEDLAAPDIRLAWHDGAVVWDHREKKSWIVGAGWERPPEEAAAELAGWLQAPPLELPDDASPSAFTSDLSREDYLARVEEARACIARGEIYQVNLVQRFTCARREPPARTYLRLRELNPAPFALYQDAGDFAVLGSSPERFIAVDPGGVIRTCPIKGTRPRGATPALDARESLALRASGKERAELLMIVDLLRNDLGRVCEFGSVHVRRLHDLESFATVHHLVGEVEGRLRPDVTLGSLLRAVFPGGSITGAPKVSALRLIDRLEPHRRGIFMGATGYVSAHGGIDLNIAIRTIVCRGDRAYFEVGAGIVWDSDAAAEYEETLAKGRALFAALGGREGAPS